jgi:hypothetical protein
MPKQHANGSIFWTIGDERRQVELIATEVMPLVAR